MYVCTFYASNEPDPEHDMLLAVIARSGREAAVFAAASRAGADDGTQEWDNWDCMRTAVPVYPGDVIGVWAAPDSVWASLGYEPTEDWRRCTGCSEVRYVETCWTLEGDDCDDCERERTRWKL